MRAKNWSKILSQNKLSRVVYVSIAFFINLHVIWVMQIMLVYTARHLHQLIAEHKYSGIGKHLLEAHGAKNLFIESKFRVLNNCHGKFNCLVYEMQFIKELRLSLNTQGDSVSAKLFV